MSMEFEIREWLDAIVDTIKKQERLSDFNKSIKFSEPESAYHVYFGIEIVADLMGLQLKCDFDNRIELPYCYSFSYRGIEFRQYEAKPLEGCEYHD